MIPKREKKKKTQEMRNSFKFEQENTYRVLKGINFKMLLVWLLPFEKAFTKMES